MPGINNVAEAVLRSGVRVSPHAIILIKFVLDAITQDPNPRWKLQGTARRPSMEALVAQEEELTNRLPELLRDMAGRGDALTTFDVLHWLQERLDTLCPFDK